MSKTPKKIAFIDAMALAYKAYFAFIRNPLTTKSGEPTSAVYGFVTQLLKIMEDLKPDAVVVALDSKEKTFRHEKYEKYKSTRAEMPEDMIPQLKRINEVIDAFGFKRLIKAGYEADDIIGTLAYKAAEHDIIAYMVTPDKDYIQLVTDSVYMIKPGKSGDELDIIDPAIVLEKYEFEPSQMIDYLALIGDKSDDIPGVKGIGEKTALPLIKQFKSLEGVYEHLEEIKSKSVKTKLEKNREEAFLSKELVTILKNVPIEVNFDEFSGMKPDFEKLENLFAELEFRRGIFPKAMKLLGKEVDEELEPEDTSVKSFDKEKVTYKLVNTSKEAKNLAIKLSSAELIVFDTETDSLDIRNINVAGASFCIEPGEAWFVAVNPFEGGGSLFDKDLNDRLPQDEFIEIFKPLFEDKNIKKVCQNGKYDIAVLRNIGIEVENFAFDTMLASYVLDPDQKHNMDDLSEKYLNYRPVPISDLIGKKKDASKIFEVELETLSNYACEDADVTYRLYKTLEEEIKKSKQERILYEIEVPLVKVLEDMERKGVKIDKLMLAKLSKKLEEQMNELTNKIYDLADEKFNVNSTKQLQEILFEKLQLTPTKKTKTGYSTDAQTLENMRGEHDIIDHLLEYRQVAKLKSTYTDALPAIINPKTGRIHTTFNQTIASTGRLSSIEPNLQNIPIRTDLGKEIRKAFVASGKDYKVLSLDYSQIELRIMASMSGDETLSEAFRQKEDIHRTTAAKVFGIKPDDVDSDMRRKAKEVNFGIMYGIGAFGLKNRLGITQGEAKAIIDNYFIRFPKVKQFIDEKIEFAKEKGYAETLYGRKRFLKNINSKNYVVRQFEERVAINMPVQGTAADMIKLAMILVHNELKKRKTKTTMVLQVHDELLFDAHVNEIDELKEIISSLMEKALPLNVPIVVEGGIADNWLDAH